MQRSWSALRSATITYSSTWLLLIIAWRTRESSTESKKIVYCGTITYSLVWTQEYHPAKKIIVHRSVQLHIVLPGPSNYRLENWRIAHRRRLSTVVQLDIVCLAPVIIAGRRENCLQSTKKRTVYSQEASCLLPPTTKNCLLPSTTQEYPASADTSTCTTTILWEEFSTALTW